MFNENFVNIFSSKSLTMDMRVKFKTEDYFHGNINNNNANGNDGGVNKKKIVLMRADVYDTEGNTVAKNVPLKTWCDTMSISFNALADVARGTRKQHKGYVAYYCKEQPKGVRKRKTKKSSIHYVEHNLILPN